MNALSWTVGPVKAPPVRTPVSRHYILGPEDDVHASDEHLNTFSWRLKDLQTPLVPVSAQRTQCLCGREEQRDAPVCPPYSSSSSHHQRETKSRYHRHCPEVRTNIKGRLAASLSVLIPIIIIIIIITDSSLISVLRVPGGHVPEESESESLSRSLRPIKTRKRSFQHTRLHTQREKPELHTHTHARTHTDTHTHTAAASWSLEDE
ncbi:hypothetical protein JOB18_037078 [Solea senegalensis]|uniref:Uncharacterized protein n=1 Tax=Solea senegalensis TaxID=28829 RepID=A0AAV6QWQ2_SOLSE|nr:hypothetical protein JOB18_037078 [Solea senegalensis]